ncbi:ECs_2282 family putative zinc-binding protein [Pseudomonas nitroreducens]|uniref:ECs_2282 family putative zinc-binding protein n=1 Tax=Pseudomonas nitroreducens TaxID=46680 RepID=UPI0039C6617F
MAQLTFKCPNCGGEQFKHPSELKDDSPITCVKCGEVRTRSQLVDHATKQTQELLKRKFGDRFKPS